MSEQIKIKIDHSRKQISKCQKNEKLEKNKNENNYFHSKLDKTDKLETKNEVERFDNSNKNENKIKNGKKYSMDLSNKPSNLEVKSRLKYLNVSNVSNTSIIHNELANSISKNLILSDSNSFPKVGMIFEKQYEQLKMLPKTQNHVKENKDNIGKIKQIEDILFESFLIQKIVLLYHQGAILLKKL